jgi:catechol 2,3-dioxygenase-like lactoylglutathione lyase family enzyme
LQLPPKVEKSIHPFSFPAEGFIERVAVNSVIGRLAKFITPIAPSLTGIAGRLNFRQTELSDETHYRNVFPQRFSRPAGSRQHGTQPAGVKLFSCNGSLPGLIWEPQSGYHFIPRERIAMTYRFHHVHIICRDLEKMISFFTHTLHASLIRRQKFGTADGASLDLAGVTVNLRVAREDERIAGDASQSSYGFDHVGLEVDDIDAAHEELSSQGFYFFTPPRDIPGLRIAFFKGPEDITIELVQTL